MLKSNVSVVPYPLVPRFWIGLTKHGFVRKQNPHILLYETNDSYKLILPKFSNNTDSLPDRSLTVLDVLPHRGHNVFLGLWGQSPLNGKLTSRASQPQKSWHFPIGVFSVVWSRSLEILALGVYPQMQYVVQTASSCSFRDPPMYQVLYLSLRLDGIRREGSREINIACLSLPVSTLPWYRGFDDCCQPILPYRPCCSCGARAPQGCIGSFTTRFVAKVEVSLQGTWYLSTHIQVMQLLDSK